MSAKIYKINFGFKDNYVVFDDNDPQYDNHHMASGITLKMVIQWIKEGGADVIYTSTTNNNPKTPTLDRVKRICKACGYYFIDQSEWRTSQWNNGEKWFDIKYELHKGKAPKNLVQGNALDHANTSPTKKVSPVKKASLAKSVNIPANPVPSTVSGLRHKPMRMVVTSFGLGRSKKRS